MVSNPAKHRSEHASAGGAGEGGVPVRRGSLRMGSLAELFLPVRLARGRVRSRRRLAGTRLAHVVDGPADRTGMGVMTDVLILGRLPRERHGLAKIARGSTSVLVL